jgi:hypothetical protein
VPRPRVYDEPRIATAVRLPEQLHERIRKAAGERQVSVNFLVERAIERYLDQMVPAGELQLHRDDGRRAPGGAR